MTPCADAPPALAQVVQRYAETNRGIVFFHLHRLFDVHDAVAARHEDLALNGVYNDGVLVRVHVTADSIDGKPASAADIAGIEESGSIESPAMRSHRRSTSAISIRINIAPTATPR